MLHVQVEILQGIKNVDGKGSQVRSAAQEEEEESRERERERETGMRKGKEEEGAK